MTIMMMTTMMMTMRMMMMAIVRVLLTSCWPVRMAIRRALKPILFVSSRTCEQFFIFSNENLKRVVAF